MNLKWAVSTQQQHFTLYFHQGKYATCKSHFTKCVRADTNANRQSTILETPLIQHHWTILDSGGFKAFQHHWALQKILYHTIMLFVSHPNILRKLFFLVSLGAILTPKRNWRQCLCKILGWQTKSIMVCYDIFCSGQLEKPTLYNMHNYMLT